MAKDLFDQLKIDLSGRKPRIVFPEGGDARIVEAATKLAEEQVIFPIIIAKKENLSPALHKLQKQGQLAVRDSETDPSLERLVEAFVERRNGKTSEEQARHLLIHDVNFFGTLLVYTGEADGLVSGAAHSTAATVRPALQIIKTKEGIKKTSGAFIMVKGDERLFFADCAINISPSASDLAETAIETARTAKSFGAEPRVAMLSFSTKGSADAPEATKVIEATKLAQTRAPKLIIDGEFQFDAAYVPSVAEKKAPDSPLKGQANVFVFPSLEAGNIGYKMVQRLGGYEAIGPILQGLRSPVNDLSRGCSAEDVYKLALITARQSLD
ncbi:MAG TPA: phosphate acetyltransferase [Candidatus Angelobacter sp.]|nr:phosphate acetyltransferase [Candidatus Angelobacter sp.]